jgi:hypothetical protein
MQSKELRAPVAPGPRPLDTDAGPTPRLSHLRTAQT